MIKDIYCAEAKKIIDEKGDDENFTVIDVRSSNEYESGHIKNAISVDIYDPDFANKINEHDKGGDYLIYCRSGRRSEVAKGIMKELGFENIYHLNGGIEEWKDKYEIITND